MASLIATLHIAGYITSEYRRDGDKMTIRISIPVGTEALVYLPSGTKVDDYRAVRYDSLPRVGRDCYRVRAGDYNFAIE